jgi:sigma-B regulation protein RsbU (phosphoserine phosphatase)
MEVVASVLTVDDEAGVRRNLSAYLEDCGYRTLEASNGREGLELFRRERPDVVLCDLRMPGMDGLEVLAHIHEESPETPVIVASGAGTLGDVVEALRRGAWDYLTKPIQDMGFLESALHRALERKRLARENREYREYLEVVIAELRQTLERLEQDEEAGRSLQFRLLPPDGQELLGCRFSRSLYPSAYLSGDFVDYFALDDRHLGFYITDVSGHGAASAFLTVMLRTTINQYREAYRQDGDPTACRPERVLARLNKDLCHQHLGKYLTICYGVIDCRRGRFTWSAGGQFPYPILTDGKDVRFLDSPGFPVGLLDEAEFTAHSVVLPKLFSLLLVSDGVLELLDTGPEGDRQEVLLQRIGGGHFEIAEVVGALSVDRERSLPDDLTFLLATNAK